jgi:hypothetical protein
VCHAEQCAIAERPQPASAVPQHVLDPLAVKRRGLRLGAALIDSLHRDSRSPGREHSVFERVVAEGAELHTGKRVRPTDCETALADLIAAGLIEQIN